MKKIVLGIFVLLFMFAFAFTTFKVDAAEIGKEYAYESEEGIVYITLIDETNAKIYAEIYEGGLKAEMTGVYKNSEEIENAIDFYVVSEIDGELIHDYWHTFILNEDGTAEDYAEVDNTPTTDDNTQEEVGKVPTIIEDKAKEFTDHIIALIVAFLGSGAFYTIVKALTKKGINALTSKVAALEDQNKISADAKKEYENKIAELEKQLNLATDKIDVVLDKICERLEIDEQKQKEMAELLEKLLPPLNEDKNKKDGE